MSTVEASNLSQNTDQHSLGDLQYSLAANPKLFSFIRNLASATRRSPNAERSAFGRHVHVEEGGQKQSWSLETPRPNIMYHVIDCAAFSTKKKTVAKTTSHKIYLDVATAAKKEGFLC